MANMTKVTCNNKYCKKEFEARTADVKRGWGKFCSKSCKAKKQGRLLASKETQKMWEGYNKEVYARRVTDDEFDHGVGFEDGHGQWE